jgi:hypothetical protein
MKEKNRHILTRAIQEMPFFKPHNAELWKNIEARLDKKISTKSDFSNLPEYKAPEDLWEKVEQKLNQGNVRTPFISAYMTRIAASIILLATIGMLIKYEYGRKSLNEISNVENSEAKVRNKLGIESIYNPALCKGNPKI